MVGSGATCDFEAKLIDEIFEVFFVLKALGDRVLVRTIGFFCVISIAAFVDYSVYVINC